MPTRITFRFDGDTQLNRTIDRTIDAVTDARPAWEVLARSFQRAERRQFSTEGAYGSGGWRPLSTRYAAWKAKRYPGKTILRRTDDLYNSLTRRPFGIEVIEPRHAIFGSGVEYARYHQLGQGVPRRRPVELTESLRREWVKVIQRFIVTGKAEARPSRAANKLHK